MVDVDGQKKMLSTLVCVLYIVVKLLYVVLCSDYYYCNILIGIAVGPVRRPRSPRAGRCHAASPDLPNVTESKLT